MSSSRRVAGPFVKLVAFAAITLVLTATLAQALGSLALGQDTTTYRAHFTDVAGLLVGDDVRIAGVRVGRVQRIALGQPDRPVPEAQVAERRFAEVWFTVDEKVPLERGVRAKIRYRNLVGQRYVALTESPSGTGRLPADGVIPVTQTTPALDLTIVFNGFRPLFTGLTPEDVNRLAFEIIQVLQGEGATMAHLLKRTASLTTSLADRDATIGRLITNLNAVLGALAERDAKLDETILRLQQFVSGLAGDRLAIGTAIERIGDLATATGGLIRDVRPDLAQDVTLLNKLAGTLNDNSQVIESTLNRLPDRYAALTRTAAYGSWFNFFLCDFDGRVGLLPGVDDAKPVFSSGAARCAMAGVG